MSDKRVKADNSDERERKRTVRILQGSGCLIAPLFILIFFCSCSWLSLLGTGTILEQDTRSSLFANYRPWEFTVFKPVDPSIIEQIATDRGKDGYQIKTTNGIGYFWLAPAPTNTPIPTPPPTLAAENKPRATPTPINIPSNTPTYIPIWIPTARNTATPTAIHIHSQPLLDSNDNKDIDSHPSPHKYANRPSAEYHPVQVCQPDDPAFGWRDGDLHGTSHKQPRHRIFHPGYPE